MARLCVFGKMREDPGDQGGKALGWQEPAFTLSPGFITVSSGFCLNSGRLVRGMSRTQTSPRDGRSHL